MTRHALFAFALLCAAAAPAQAASRADLAVSFAPPAGVHVYESGHYGVVVANLGTRNAAGVTLTIQLPLTHTSPTQYIMGTLGAVDPRCAIVGTHLSCALGTVTHGASTTVGFDLTMPYSTAPLTLDATAATTTLPEVTLANNVAHHTQALLDYPVSMTPPDAAVNRHCTGQGLTSFYECTLFPSSIAAHDTIFNADHTITFVGAPPQYTGTWSQPTPDNLQFQYFDTGILSAEFDGRGVSGNCFEGPTLFPGSAYMSMYQVCLP